QTCIAPDYVLAPRNTVEMLAEAVIEQARQAYPTIEANRDYTAIISERHVERLARAVAEAERAGVKVLRHADSPTGASRKFGPTVVVDPPRSSELMREEIFGPVLPIVPYDSLDEAIAFINS